jgi:transcriptional regulator with XRE-family HTH domain
MSKLLDITQPAYSYYEKGEKPIPLNKMQKISEILSIPIKTLLGDIVLDEKNEDYDSLYSLVLHLIGVSCGLFPAALERCKPIAN